MGSGNADQGKSGKYLPSKREITKAVPGLLAVVFPITVVAELLWYIELKSETTFFVDIFIAAVLALIVANVFKIPERFKAGPALAQKWFLRFGIIISGLKFSYGYLVESGWQN